MNQFFNIIRIASVGLRRDKFALALSFLLPVIFFAVFSMIYSGRADTTPKISIIIVDQDQSDTSKRLVQTLKNEASLHVFTSPKPTKENPAPPNYNAATAEAAVKAGEFPVALIIPSGYGDHPISFGPQQQATQIELLNDSSDMIAPQMVNGLLQKAAMSSMSPSMAEEGMKLTAKNIGGFTPEQQKRANAQMAEFRHYLADPANGNRNSASSNGEMIQVHNRPVVGENKPNPMIAFYAAAFGVMFLLWTSSGAAGSLLDESESGTLDRILASRVSIGTLLAGKMAFAICLAFSQLTVMFVFGWLVYRVDLPHHIPGFVVMGLSTSFAVAAFGILLASICRTRAQLGPLSTILIMSMSAIGGSMFPRYFMPQAMQTAGLFTINGWAIDGFTNVFWRDMPVSALWPQVSVLVGIGVTLFLIASRIARRWDYT
jgi:ABC-2 type transport system permease protein